jgi:two-component system, NarL family, sensor histidine kinase EvgS
MKLPAESYQQGPAEDNRPQPLPSSGLRIMVVEDDDIVRELFSRYLCTKGHQVTGACSGEEGLKLFRSGHFDLIVMDLSLMDMSGLDLSRRIKKNDKHTRIILCSGCELQQRQQELHEAGINAFLQKPVRMADLSRVIEESMENVREISA